MPHPVKFSATARGNPSFVVRSGMGSRLRCMAVAAALALGTSLEAPLADLRAELALGVTVRPGSVRVLSGGNAGNFQRP